MITFRKKQRIGGDKLSVTVDVVLRIKHGVEAQVSTSPLEEGADITDHVRVLPQGVEVVGIVVPRDQTNVVAGLASGGGLAGLGGGLGNIGALLGLGEDQRDIEAWMTLKAMIAAREPIEVVTRYQVYFVLPIVLLADEDAGFGQALQFSMRFIEIERGAVNSLDQIAVELRDTVGGKTGTDNLGGQQLGAEEAVDPALAKSKPRVVNPWTAAYEVAA